MRSRAVEHLQPLPDGNQELYTARGDRRPVSAETAQTCRDRVVSAVKGDRSFLLTGKFQTVDKGFALRCVENRALPLAWVLDDRGERVLAFAVFSLPQADPRLSVAWVSLELVCTCKDARGRGLATALLAYVERFAAQHLDQRCASRFVRLEAVSPVLSFYQGGFVYELDHTGSVTRTDRPAPCKGLGYVQADNPCDPEAVERSRYNCKSKTYRLTKCVCGQGNRVRTCAKSRRGIIPKEKPARPAGSPSEGCARVTRSMSAGEH